MEHHSAGGGGKGHEVEALREAVEACHPARVIELLKMGAPSVLDSEGQTPLHLAAANGHLQLVDALIQAGCDVTVQDFVSSIYSNIVFKNFLRKGFVSSLVKGEF